MRYTLLLALGASAGAIATTLNQTITPQNIQVTLHFLKGDYPQPSITAYNNDRSEVVGYSCSTSLALGTSLIAFIVDQNGSGNITVNEEEFRVLDDPEFSGGVICGRIHNAVETIVNCELAVPATLYLLPLNRRNLPECKSMKSASTGQASGLEAILDGFLQRPEFLPIEQPLELPDNSTVAPRQCGIPNRETYLIGNGNPHQNPLNVQLSCGSRDGCQITYTTTRSFSIGWTASATAWQWLSGGFAVEMSIETGNSYSCPGSANDYFAVWIKQAQTAYTVRNRLRISCAPIQDSGGNYVIWSPNRGNRGGYPYCVYGRQYVRWIGDRWLDTTPIPGGPP
ncbi:hypothetical protein ColLi_06904 [Colletotrichum liriopes]|uniref:Uncharacterized protein n=1 Tax=Colletotrichum liriopes TaxID=708192 RepID=A0AA37GPI2_9PEZI|nr:hypothetical protein ColLi_06904 [Colletotrichum liriopes]